MHVRALLQGAGGDEWRAAIVDALVVMQRMDGQKLESMPCPQEAPQEWEALWRSHLAAWAHLVKRFLALAGESPEKWERACIGTPLVATASEPESEEVLCARCARTFTSHRAWRLHTLHKHGERVPERCLVTVTACPVSACSTS